MPKMRIPLWLKMGWTFWVIVWAPIYWRQYGPQNFLFLCDLGNLLIAIGLWLESSLIFSAEAAGLLLFQSLFAIDLVIALLSGKHLIGGTEYMFDPHIAWWIRALSLFHLVMPPLLLWVIWLLGYDKRGWKYQTLVTWFVIPINYFWHPQDDVNWARGPFFREQHFIPALLYLLAYLIFIPAIVYFPTHVFLLWLTRRWRAKA
jgi:hypothetical protein